MAARIYKQRVIILTEVDRDWSEDAWEYRVKGTTIKDECEGLEEAEQYAKEEIDKL
jgi:hypothetical protein